MAPPSLRITGVQVTAGDASMTLQNTGSTEVDLSNWEVRVGTSTVRLPANTRLGPADTLTLHSSAGSSSGRDVYLGQGAAALVSGLQPGARVSLLDSHGNLVTEFSVPGS